MFKVSYLPAAFNNLSQLKLVLRGRDSWEFLTELLKKSPNLKHLKIEQEVSYSYFIMLCYTTCR